jgi:hypothetical protein
MSTKLLSNIYLAIASHYNFQLNTPFGEKEKTQFQKKLSSINSPLEKLIKSYEKSFNSVDFFKKEKEMRIKFPDIWEAQVSQAKNAVAIIKEQLIDTGVNIGLDLNKIFEENEGKKLSLDDFKDLI